VSISFLLAGLPEETPRSDQAFFSWKEQKIKLFAGYSQYNLRMAVFLSD
jgi:hypothetical protein